MANPLRGQLPTVGLQIADADPSTDESPPSLDKVAMLRGEKVADICNITLKLLKAKGEIMIPWVACDLDCCMATW